MISVSFTSQLTFPCLVKAFVNPATPTCNGYQQPHFIVKSNFHCKEMIFSGARRGTLLLDVVARTPRILVGRYCPMPELLSFHWVEGSALMLGDIRQKRPRAIADNRVHTAQSNAKC
jgi:hypothetical protein